MNTKTSFQLDVNNGQFTFHLSEGVVLLPPVSDDDLYYILDNHKVKRVSVIAEDHNAKRYQIQIDGRMYNVQISDEVDQQILKMNLKSKKTNLLLELKAPMPGVVRQVHFKNGDAVVKGDALIILEAMKMENVLRAPFDGIVGEISVKPGEAVEKNQLLLRFH